MSSSLPHVGMEPTFKKAKENYLTEARKYWNKRKIHKLEGTKEDGGSDSNVTITIKFKCNMNIFDRK